MTAPEGITYQTYLDNLFQAIGSNDLAETVQTLEQLLAVYNNIGDSAFWESFYNRVRNIDHLANIPAISTTLNNGFKSKEDIGRDIIPTLKIFYDDLKMISSYQNRPATPQKAIVLVNSLNNLITNSLYTLDAIEKGLVALCQLLVEKQGDEAFMPGVIRVASYNLDSLIIKLCRDQSIANPLASANSDDTIRTTYGEVLKKIIKQLYGIEIGANTIAQNHQEG